jgi:Domain of unknown function (DUF4148)
MPIRSLPYFFQGPTMNRIIASTLIAASAAFAGQAFADDITPSEPFQSSRTREEVRAEYIASRDEVAAMTAEDSGAFALAQEQANAQVAGVPADRAAE